MLDIIKKYNKLKAGGSRLTIYVFGTYLLATLPIGYLGLIVGSPFLTLPLVALIFHPIIWITIGIVLTVICKIAVKTLYNLIKGFINKKERERNGQKVSDGNSNTASDSEHRLENSSYRSFTTSKDNNLSCKTLYENLPTLVHQTNRENYAYWLQQHDIAHIARAVYNYTESSDDYISFCIPGNLETLNERLIEYKNKVEQKDQKAMFTSVINLGNHHWTTLVIAYNSSNKQFIAYYCDSFRVKLPRSGSQRNNIENANKIKNELVTPLSKQASELNAQGKKEMGKDVQKTAQMCRNKKDELVNIPINTDSIVSALEAALKIESNNIRNSLIKQQNDDYNCGIFALENAHKITQKLSEGKSFDEIDKELSKYKFDLNKKRREFAEALMQDKQWKEDLKNGLLCELLPGVQTSLYSTSKKEKVSWCSIT
ncbi:hypothetical protein [Wolbachia endosymbiont of Dirofilaria (Dirofilaria) immitis]|uniref:hypothetical protein n=1 Tax=Wolbachia endosymbiont of Dirofilaria (Dirofilaria) immitis TaxID=1812115 RepID=UPI0015897E49|nr:hypothetical protein [Wolbachia endosymbiont of Dirofilaria (Dirofilaria) immitis]QKX01997.1 hypothetical protein GOY12_00035 [Wolbachia endosymbiont of Dirofilaria (Dirofilaria) immitis]